jgi:hypothetical protein
MSDRPVCNYSNHLFVPILEVTAPLLRCIHCNVYAYHDTVKQLAKNRAYHEETERIPQRVQAPPAPELPFWRRMWLGLRRNLGFA